MAKTLTGVTRRLQIEWTGTGVGDVRLRFLSFDMDTLPDDADPDLLHRLTGTEPDKKGPRDLESAELALTVTALLTSFDDSIKTAEGIP